ncbi:MAG: hypothetical protein ACM3ZV_04090 [Bacillota bacterium]
MKHEERDYFAARLLEEREAAQKASTSAARTAHEQMALYYEQALTARSDSVLQERHG